MGKNGYQKCKELIEIIKTNGIENQIDLKTLKLAILKNIATDEKLVKRYIYLLCEFGFLKTNNNVVFEFGEEA